MAHSLLAFAWCARCSQAKTSGEGAGSSTPRWLMLPDDDYFLCVHRHGHGAPDRAPTCSTPEPQDDVYETSDARFVSSGVARVTVSHDETMPKQMDRASWPDLEECLRRARKTKTRDEWGEIMEHTDAAPSMCSSLAEGPTRPQHRARDVRRAQRCGAARPPSFAGPQHTHEALGDWGLDANHRPSCERRVCQGGSSQEPHDSRQGRHKRRPEPLGASTLALHAHPDDESTAPPARWPRPRPTVTASCSSPPPMVSSVTRPGVLAEGEPLWRRRGAGDRRARPPPRRRAVELLGYHDSGMMGEPTNDDPACFWQADVRGGGRATDPDRRRSRRADHLRRPRGLRPPRSHPGPPGGQPGGQAGRGRRTCSRRR